MNISGLGGFVFRAALAAVWVSASLGSLLGTSTPNTRTTLVDRSRPQPLAMQPRRAPRVSRLRRGTSTNWSGYAALGSNFTDVVGTWTVPPVTGSAGAPSSFSAHWVGVDGYSDGTVEQLGTEADVDSAGHTQYYAWFEMYPRPGYYITLPNDGYVLPGNQMMAEVRYGAGSRFQLRLTNLSQRWFFQTSQWQPAQRSSAEWIVEAPSTWSGGVLPLADFNSSGPSGFTNCGAAVNFGNRQPISNYHYDPLTMVGNNGPKAVPSGLLGGNSFTIQWFSSL